jgi:hypothetical protein
MRAAGLLAASLVVFGLTVSAGAQMSIEEAQERLAERIAAEHATTQQATPTSAVQAATAMPRPDTDDVPKLKDDAPDMVRAYFNAVMEAKPSAVVEARNVWRKAEDNLVAVSGNPGSTSQDVFAARMGVMAAADFLKLTQRPDYLPNVPLRGITAGCIGTASNVMPYGVDVLQVIDGNNMLVTVMGQRFAPRSTNGVTTPDEYYQTIQDDLNDPERVREMRERSFHVPVCPNVSLFKAVPLPDGPIFFETDTTYWIEGLDTAGIVNDQFGVLGGAFEVTGTKTYETASGSQTVALFRSFDIHTWLNQTPTNAAGESAKGPTDESATLASRIAGTLWRASWADDSIYEFRADGTVANPRYWGRETETWAARDDHVIALIDADGSECLIEVSADFNTATWFDPHGGPGSLTRVP